MADPRSFVPYHDPHDNSLNNLEYIDFMTDSHPNLDHLSPMPEEHQHQQLNSSSVLDHNDDVIGPNYPFDDPIWHAMNSNNNNGFTNDQSNQAGPSNSQHFPNVGDEHNYENNENFRPPWFDNGRPVSVWPPPVAPYQCSFCQVLREIIHTNGNCSTKLEIHGRLGIICHAILENKVNDTAGSSGTQTQCQMIDFCKKSIDNVKQFLIQYCENQKNAGFVMLQDPLLIFYEALCVGIDQWDDDPNNDDFNDPSPSTFPSGARQGHEMEGGNEAERATTITPTITPPTFTLAQQCRGKGLGS